MALGLAAPVAAQPPSPLPEAAAEVTEGGRYPAHEAAFPNGVRGLPGLVYREPLGYRALTLDLYLPPGSLERPAGGFPLVIYIHGGGWMGGDARSSGPFAGSPGVLASLAARGYVVASIAYRLSGEARFPAQAQDVKAAIRWLRLEAPRFGIDPARAVTWGVSAGGHLSGLAALGCKAAALEAVESGAPDPGPDPIPGAQVSDCVQAGVAWYGVFDMATIAAQSRRHGAMSRDVPGAPEWRLLGCFGEECTPQQIAAASPVTYVDADDPPMLLIVGSADTTVPHQQTLEMAETLDAAGVEHELIVLPGLNHSFIGKTPEETREANRKALEATFRFIDRTIGRASTPSP